MDKRPICYHPMETAPQDGTVVWLRIRPLYVGCPIDVLGSWSDSGWTCIQSLDGSRDLEPLGWAEP